MSVASEIQRIKNGIASVYEEISAMGGEVPQTQNLDNLVASVGTISGQAVIDGLDYAEGTVTPNADTQTLSINFSKAHSTTPTIVLVKDNTVDSSIGALGIMNWLYFDYEKLGNKLVMPTNSGGTSNRFADVIVYARTDTTASYGNTTNVCLYSSSTTTSTYTKYYPRYFVSETGFETKLDWISSSSSIKNAVFKANRQYKWYAIWTNYNSILTDYFETNPQSITTSEEAPWCFNFTKKAPDLIIPAGTSSLSFLFYMYKGFVPKIITDDSVTNMSYMYAGAKMNGHLDCSAIDTTNVNQMEYMFADCTATSIDASGLGTVYISDARGLFMNCNNATNIDIHNFDLGNYVDGGNMFNNTKKLAVLDASSLSFNKISYKNSIFVGCGTQCLQSDGAYADGIPYIYVKDTTQQQWILNLGSNIPSSWSENNVVVKNS